MLGFVTEGKAFWLLESDGPPGKSHSEQCKRRPMHPKKWSQHNMSLPHQNQASFSGHTSSGVKDPEPASRVPSVAEALE